MVDTEHHSQYEDLSIINMRKTWPDLTRAVYLEERDEGVGGWGPTEDEGEEGGETSIEDRRANLLQAGESSLQSSPRAHYEAVPDVDAVVDTETNRDDDVNAGHDVDGDVPEVKVANNVDQSDADHHHDLH